MITKPAPVAIRPCFSPITRYSVVMSDIRASNLRMIGFSLPALGLNTLVTAVFVFLPALYAEHRGLGASAVGTIFLIAKLIDMIGPVHGQLQDALGTPPTLAGAVNPDSHAGDIDGLQPA